MRYKIIRQNVMLVAGTPFLTIVPATGRSLLIAIIDISGDGTSSGYNEINVHRVLAAGTGAATANTLIAQTNESPNMTGTTPALALAAAVNTVYGTTQPTFTATAILKNCPVNSNGARYYWEAATVADMIKVPASTLGVLFNPVAGTGPVSIEVTVEEI